MVESCNAILRSAIWIICLPWLWCGCRAPALSEQQSWEIRQRALAELKLSAATADDPQIRVRALRGLEADGDAHFDSWTRLASYDPAPAVRLEAILLLRNRRADLSTNFWRRLLDDEDELVRAGAMLCLIEAGRSEYGQLLERVRHTEMELRRRPSAIPLLLALNERAEDDGGLDSADHVDGTGKAPFVLANLEEGVLAKLKSRFPGAEDAYLLSPTQT
ncbi:MAG: hypothetical protein IH895_05315, partial [Planctomycetes bacterium]|nr:hypothetical protein [Planctomycetota bacterium]